jgi:putative oxidoreductase
MFPALVIFGDWTLLALRLVLAFIFIIHGWPKIKNLKQTALNFQMMGFKPGFFWGIIVAVAEFFGGILLLTGWFVQVAALILAIEFVVATLWKIRSGQKFAGGFEFDLLILAAVLVLAAFGGGFYGLDNYLPVILY